MNITIIKASVCLVFFDLVAIIGQLLAIFCIITGNYMQPIFLIGYMGCGKSTLGRAVSALTGMRFIDLDSYIESRTVWP